MRNWSGVLRLFALLALLPLRAAAADVDFDRIEILRAGEEVLSLAQTADGFLWVGTPAGLYRYDGRDFTVADAPDLRRPVVALLAGADGALWVGLNRPPEVARLTLGSGATPVAWKAARGLGLRRVRALAATGEGGVWAGGDGGLFRISPDGPAARQPWPADARGSVRALVGVDPQRLLVGLDAEGGSTLEVLDAADGSRRPADARALDVRVRALAADGASGLWVGTRSGLLNVPAGGAATDLGGAAVRPLSGRAINAVLRDRDGNLWLATAQGLVRAPPRRLHRAFAVDRGEVVSVLTAAGGSVFLLLDPDTLLRVEGDRIVEQTPAGLAPHGLIGLVEDSEGVVWAGSWQEGLFRLHQGSLAPHALPGWNRGETIRPLLFSRRHGVVLAVGDGRLATSAAAAVEWHDLRELGVRSEIVAGAEDAPGGLWLASERHGLVRMETGSARRLGRAQGLPSENLTALLCRSDGSLWIGTRDVGLVLHRGGRFFPVGRARGLGTNSIAGIVADGRGHLWLTTPGDGVIRARESDLLRAAGGDRSPIDRVTFTTADGLAANGSPDRAPPAGGVDKEGRLWLALYRGAVVFPDPAAPSARSLPAPRLESAWIDGREIAMGAGPAQVSIKSGQGVLQVRYTAVLFEGRQRLRFRHRLAGLAPDLLRTEKQSASRAALAPDSSRTEKQSASRAALAPDSSPTEKQSASRAALAPDWHDAGDAQEASYTGLAPGSYRFEVVPYFAGAALDEPAAPATFAFVLVPPFYRTRVFYLGSAALAGALVLLAFRLRGRLLRQRFAAVADERNRIAREIHDSLEQTLYAAKLQLEAARARAPGGEPREQIARGVDLVERGIDEARAAVWALRTGVFGRADLAVAISVTAGEALRATNVAFTLDTEGAIYRLPAVTEWHVGQIVREAFTNALKHASPTRIDVRLAFEPDRLVVEIRDDGVGFAPGTGSDADTDAGHYGLLGMRERLRSCRGSVTLESVPGEGTCVRIDVPRASPERA